MAARDPLVTPAIGCRAEMMLVKTPTIARRRRPAIRARNSAHVEKMPSGTKRLSTGPTKPSETIAAGSSTILVEPYAIEANRLRALLRINIEALMPAIELAVLKAAEASGRTILRAVFEKMNGAAE